MATKPENRPSTTKLENGRIVTESTAWWYQYTTFQAKDNLYCIHSKNLLTGCNDCADGKGYGY